VRLLQNIFPGMEVEGNPGELLKAFSPNVGGSDFLTHSRLVLTFIAINLDMPVHIMLLDPSQTNFSGWRGAIDQARIKWREIQTWLIDSLHRPTYLWKVRQWLVEDSPRGRMLRAAQLRGVNLFGHIWHPPGWSYIEPLKDAQADALEVGSNLNSPRRVLGRKQLDWKRICNETVEDLALFVRRAKQEAAKINSEFDDDQPVHWRELMASPLPAGISMAIQPVPDEPEPVTEQRKEAA
jgi:capsid protein